MSRFTYHRLAAALILPLLWGLAIALLAGASARCAGQVEESDRETDGKVEMVLNCIRNADWPKAAFAAPDSPIVVSFMGDGEIIDKLRRTAGTYRVQGRAIEVRQLVHPKGSQDSYDVSDEEMKLLLRQASDSHVLFICKSRRNLLDAILRHLGSADVLTVSDMDSFTERGGMLGLSVSAGQIVVDINSKKIQATRLKVNTQILQIKESDRALTIKAGMVLNFIRYTDWPETAFAATDSPIVISMLGDVEMDSTLRRTVSDQRVRGRGIEIRQVSLPKPSSGKSSVSDAELQELIRQVTASHVLFIGDSEKHRVDAVLGHLESENILTVSDMDGFAERGGMLGLTIRRKRVAVEANLGSIQETDLKVSSQLLRLAQAVKTRGH